MGRNVSVHSVDPQTNERDDPIYRWIAQVRFAIFMSNAHILSVSEVHGLLSLAGIGEIVRSGSPGHGSLF